MKSFLEEDMRKVCQILFLLINLSFQLAVGATDSVSHKIHHHYVAPRILGMGDAFVAVANDYNAIFYNPAGLARREDGELNLSMDFSGATSFMDFVNDIDSASKSSNSQQAVLDVIDGLYGTAYGIRAAPANGILVRPKWGIAVIPMDISAELTMHKQVGPTVNTTLIGDSTVAFGYGKDVAWIPNSRTSVGYTLKFVNRIYYSQSMNFVELGAGGGAVGDNEMREGYSVDADLGMLVTPELPSEGFFSVLRLARPTFGAVVRNVGETGFKQSLKLINKDGTGTEPEKMYRVIDLGSRWEYPAGWIFSGRGVMDVRDILHPNFNIKKGLHLGFEFDWTMASWWKGQYRFGLNQGYWTAGMSALLGIFNLDLVSYGEDVGTQSNPIENRVFMVRGNINF